MREIKFRAWDKTNKKWALGGPFHVIGEVTLFDLLKQYRLEKLIDIEVSQFTGLKDSKGNDIYENDVVKASIYSDEDPQILEVKYRSCCFIIDYEDSESDTVSVGDFVGTIEIIGNSFENPEII